MMIEKQESLSSYYYECIERAKDAWMHSYNLTKSIRAEVQADKAVFESNANAAIKEAFGSYESMYKSIMHVAGDFDDLPGFSPRNLYNHLDDENRGRLRQYNNLQDMEVCKSISQNILLMDGDFSKVSNQIENNSIPLIFTDPPYDHDSLFLYEELARLAARVLKPGGSLVTYSGGYHKPEVFDRLLNGGNGELRYWWDIAVKHTGAIPFSQDRKVNICWKSLLWFVKGNKLDPAFPLKPINDLIESRPPDKSIHEWAQSPVEAKQIISNLSLENDMVLDPMMGSGTTAIASLDLNRRFMGIEIDPVYFANAQERIKSYVSSR